jgi:putative ABC transport system permease protein
MQFFVRGVWRDYSRQSGALLMPLSDYQRWSGDSAITELSLWLPPGADIVQTQAALRALAADPADLELAATGELLTLSLRLFDRSFAVTYWLQAVALGLGLFGIAASLSAQVLARKREFGLLRHLGFTQAQLLRLLVLETALFTAAGALAGLALGLAVSAVLVWVVNPQSFHWSMDLSLPAGRLAGLLLAVLAASLLTAWLSFARAGQVDAVQAVREDW